MIDPAIIDAMLAAGASAEVIAAAFKADHAIEAARLAGRREKATERKRRSRAASRDVTPSHTMSHQNSVTDAHPLLPPPPPSPLSPITPFSLTPSTPLDPKSSLRSLDRKRDPFDEFWEIYPKRDGTNPRHPARKRFIAALKSGIEPETIITGARAFAAECKDRGHIGTPYVAQATTWLNQRRWGDVPTDDAPATGPPTDLTPEQQADWAKGWRPGMPTSAELKARSTTNGHAHDAGADHPKELFPKGAGVRGDAPEGGPQKPPHHH